MSFVCHSGFGIESMEQRRDREYKLILESELYDLPQSAGLQVQAEVCALAIIANRGAYVVFWFS